MSTAVEGLSATDHLPAPARTFHLEFKHVIAIFLLGSTCVALWRLFPLSSKDIWSQLKYGEWITVNSRLPEIEPFCAPAAEAQEATHTQWLTQVAFYHIYRLGAAIAGGSELNRLGGGVEMLRFALALLVLVRMTLLTIAFRRVTDSLGWALAAMGVSLLVTWSNLVELRPHVVGEVFFAALLMMLSRPTPSRAATFVAPALFVLWANCHASFLGGFGLIVLCIAARFLDRTRLGLTFGDLIWRDLRTRRLAIMLLLSVPAVGFLNPHDWHLFDRILTRDGHANGLAMAEWQALHVERTFGWSWIFLASMALAIGTHLLSPRGFSAGDLLLIFAFAAAGCIQEHMLVWWAMVLPWVLAPHWVEIASCGTPETSAYADDSGRTRPVVAIAAGVIVGGLVAASPLFSWMWHGRSTPLNEALDTATPWAFCLQLQTEPNPELLPLPRLHDIIATNYGGQFRGKIIVTPRTADFPLWRGYAVSVSSQLDRYKPKYWTDYDQLLKCNPGWWETLDVWEANLIILGPDEYAELRRKIENDSGWEVLHTGGPWPDLQYGVFDGWVAVRKIPVAD